MRSFFRDARHCQIAALGTLLAVNLAWLDFGAAPGPSLVLLATVCLTQIACTRLARLKRLDLRSPLITGMSLSLLLRADALWVYALAGGLAIGSKFVLRVNGKHLFNPAAFAIAALLLGTDHVWVSPGQWGSTLWLALLLGVLAMMVLIPAARSDIALFFLGSYGALLFGRALWLGDPLAIPLHQVQSGSLLLFAFFMISDPRTTPDARIARFLFAAAVAGLAHYLAFAEQVRPALFLALAALAPLVPVLDRLFAAERHQWSRPSLAKLPTPTPTPT